jgi:hypothetical protein
MAGRAAVAALVLWQGWLTLSLFGPDEPLRRLTDGRPVLSGRHPLHLYHGHLGARSRSERGGTCCYDPAFQAGYPKTPLFDSGCRPAELFLTPVAGEVRPELYKLGLALGCLAVPVVFVIAARSLGLRRGAAVLAGLLGVLSWWSAPVQRLLEEGEIDWLLGGQVLLLHLAFLVSFTHRMRLGSWLGLVTTAALGWFAHPLLWVGFAPLIVAFFLRYFLRRGLGWHLSLLAAWVGGAVGNLGLISDWVRFWWIHLPVRTGAVTHSLRNLLPASADRGWGDAPDQLFAGLLAVGGLLGLVVWRCRRRQAVRLLLGGGAVGLSAFGLIGAARNESPWPSVAPQLLIVAAWLLVVPCAAALAWHLGRVARGAGRAGFGVGLGLGVALFGGLALMQEPAAWIERAWRAPPLTVGLSDQREELARTLREQTTPDARILWEDRRPGRGSGRWTALLPLWTGRHFLGGLDPDAGVEHVFAALGEESLAGRPLADWTDAELDRFCARYNVGWVVAWSPAAVERFDRWPRARRLAAVRDGESGWLFALDRPRSFVLKGRAKLVQADAQRVALADVVPEDGVIVLSLHHHDGWHVMPPDVVVERDPDVDDPIPFLRLRLTGPLSRLTLTWEP